MTRCWDDAAAAARYERFRPDAGYQLVHEHLRPLLEGRLPLELAIDLGSGTGQSTRPLLALAGAVIGVEPSEAMRAQARGLPGVTFCPGSGEETGLSDACADLVHAGLAFHWMDHARAAREIGRILKPGGLLVIVDDGFTGEMEGQPAFAAWWSAWWQTCLAGHPAPARGGNAPSPELASAAGLARVPIGNACFDHWEIFTPASLAGFATTQSSPLIYLQRTGQDPETWIARFAELLRPFFPAAQARIRFQGWIGVWRKTPSASRAT